MVGYDLGYLACEDVQDLNSASLVEEPGSDSYVLLRDLKHASRFHLSLPLAEDEVVSKAGSRLGR